MTDVELIDKDALEKAARAADPQIWEMIDNAAKGNDWARGWASSMRTTSLRTARTHVATYLKSRNPK